MHFLVIFATGLAVVHASTTPSLAEENNCPGIKNDRSLLSSLLAATGYSDTCVASALDFCSTGQADGGYVSLVEEAREVVQQLSAAVNTWESQVSAAIEKWDSQFTAAARKSESLPRHCKDLLDSGDTGSGLRYIYPYSDAPHYGVPVICDHTVDGGGWTVFQRRTNETNRENFKRNWAQYQAGFGDMEAEFWLGLKVLHQLTSTTMQQLRVDLEDYEGQRRYATYGYFYVGPKTTNYRLSVGNYSGNAGDSLKHQNGQQFTTHDADNDKKDNGNCAESREGAWWFKHCANCNLNGYQYVGSDSPQDKGIFWDHWRGDTYSLKRTTMMARPSN